MPTARTAISLDPRILREADELAQQMGISRSKVFERAVEDFVRRQQNRQILERLNQVYAGDPDPEDKEFLQAAKAYRRRYLEEEW